MPAKRFAIIGHPVLHSKSPVLHQYWFRKMKIAAGYSRIIAADGRQALQLASKLGIHGLNVTAPFKQMVMEQTAHLSAEALGVGAVNTLIFNKTNTTGYNTDVTGILRAFKINRVPLKEHAVLVIGAGGAARAVLYALRSAQAHVTLVNRTIPKGQALAAVSGVNFKPLNQLATCVRRADIIINTLPMGINIIQESWLNDRQIVLDANYHHSLLEPMTRAVGAHFIPGTTWLIEQARPAFKLFTGKTAAGTIPEQVILENPFASLNNIVLTGSMGAGKTALGERLAQRLGWKFTDTDQDVENTCGRTITQIFRAVGEDHFRVLESRALAKALTGQRQVIATGGGIILSAANRALLRKKALNIWLFARPDQVWSRISPTNRPLLQNGASRTTARDIFQERFEHYFMAADAILDTEEPTITRCTDLLYAEVSQLFKN